MNIERVVVGPLRTNVYILSFPKTTQAFVVDPGDEADAIRSVLQRQGLQVHAVLLTHGHFDHIGAVYDFGVPIYIHPADRHCLRRTDFVRPMEDGAVFDIAGETLQAIHTPGHSPGSMCLLADKVLLSGDTLFCQGIGRTDLAGGSYDDIERSIRERLFTLDGSVRVLPGHGPETTIAAERGG